MNNQTTLFLIQSSFANTDKILSELPSVASPEDCIVILGEALLKITPAFVEAYPKLYCLGHEQSLLDEAVQPSIHILQYAGFADLVLQFQRCVTLK